MKIYSQLSSHYLQIVFTVRSTTTVFRKEEIMQFLDISEKNLQAETKLKTSFYFMTLCVVQRKR
jgi:hypothetical protein